MKSKVFTLGLVGLVLSIVFSGPVQAKASASQMSPEMQAMMAKVKKAGTPAEGHERLQPLVGEWKAATKMWMKPGDKAQQSEGTSSNHWILGNRYLEQNFKGNWAGEAFEGLGILGYDNVREEYQSVWMDSMSTSIAEGTGGYNAANKTIGNQGSHSCPLTPTKIRDFRSEWKLINADKHIFNMYTQDEAGKEFKSMEIVYTRVK